MNRTILKCELTDGWLPFVHEKDVWPLISRLNSIMRQEATRLGDTYADIPVEDSTRPISATKAISRRPARSNSRPCWRRR